MVTPMFTGTLPRFIRSTKLNVYGRRKVVLLTEAVCR
jgi:hypothetical protein